MESTLDHQTARALLEWQVELGVSDAICDAPLDRRSLPTRAPWLQKPAARADAQAAPPHPVEADPVAEARRAAEAARTLPELRAALQSFDHLDLRKGARNLVFSDGVAGAPVMIVGEAPGRDEDREGRPFVGRAGQLLDRMLAAVGLSRAESVYISNVLPWRPPHNRDPKPDEIAMMRPFLDRHIALAAPKVIILMGNISCDAVLARRGILRMRGHWAEAGGRPVLPMVHPAYLLRNPAAKRDAWADLLSLQARMRTL